MALALCCITEFSWHQQKMPALHLCYIVLRYVISRLCMTLHCGAVRYVMLLINGSQALTW